MIRRPPRSTLTDTCLPYTTLFRSGLPQVSVFHWFAISRTPAIFLPAENPLRYTILHIIAVGRHNDMAGAGEGAQSLDRRHQFHAVVGGIARSEEHTSELQSLMRTSYAVFCLKQKNTHMYHNT